MKHKSETFNMLTHFFNQINRQFNTKIYRINFGNGGIFLPQLQTIRSNNGTKFLSKQIQTWFHENDTIHQCSYIVTPQQNGVVIDISLMLLELYDFKQTSLFLFGVNVLSLPPFLLTNFQL